MAGTRFSTVGKVLFLQVLVMALAVAAFAIAQGMQQAWCAFLGGAAAFIPNLYFAFRIKRAQGQDPQKIVRAFYVGESGKLVLTTVMFALIFQLPNIKILPLMTGFVAALSTFWFALIVRD